MVYYTSCFCSYVWVCGISVWFIYNKRNYLFVRCQSLSHIPNTSLQCSNQPLWKLNLVTGVNTTKQQTGEIKNTIKRVILWAKQISEAATEMSWKKDVLINNLVPSSFHLRKKPVKNTIFSNFFIRWKPQGTPLKVADCQPATLLKLNFFVGFSRILTANFRAPIFQNTS